MQYLIRRITDSTGHPFVEVIKPRENERYEIVSAESKEEAEEMVKDRIQCPRCKSWNTNHEYYYIENDPVYIAFKCFNCGAMYGEYIEKDSE